MDYSLFFYGFSLFILGMLALKFYRERIINLPWIYLALFGFFAAFHEWLFLFQRLHIASPAVNGLKGVLLLASLLSLLEFSRLSLKRRGLSISALTVYPLILIIFLFSSLLGLPFFSEFNRLFIAVTANLLTLFLSWRIYRKSFPHKKLLLAVNLLILGYALSLLFVTTAEQDPIAIFSGAHFYRHVGISIFLVRGLLIYSMVFCLWFFTSIERDRIAVREAIHGASRLVVLAALIPGVILLTGWLATERAGVAVLDRSVKHQTGYAATLKQQIESTLELDRRALRNLIGLPEMVSALQARSVKPATVLQRWQNTLGCRQIFLIDIAGKVKMSAHKDGLLYHNNETVAKESYFFSALRGIHHTVYKSVNSKDFSGIILSAPVHDRNERIIGVIAIARDLSPLLRSGSPRYHNTFIIDPDGVIFLSTRPELESRPLWPVSEATAGKIRAKRDYGLFRRAPVLQYEFRNHEWVSFQGRRQFAVLMPLTDDNWQIAIVDDVFFLSTVRLFVMAIVSLISIILITFFIVLERSRVSTARIASSENQFRSIFNNAPQAICLVDRENFSILDTNSVTPKLLGYKKERLIGRHLQEIIAGGFSRFKTEAGRLKDDERLPIKNYKLIKRSGGFLDVEGICSLLTYENTTCLILFINDITDRKKAEKEIRDNENKYRNLFDNASDAIILLDSGQIFDCNAKAVEMFRTNRESMIGKRPEDYLPEFQQEDVRSSDMILEQMITVMEGHYRRFTCRCMRSDQDMFEADISMNRIDVRGAVLIQSIIRDVSEQKQIEHNLKEARDKALEASRIKSEFLANMSHEIRTPMNGVMGMLDLLYGTEISSEQRDYLAIAKNSAEALLALINDILDFSKIEAGRLDIEQVRFAPAALVDGVGEALAKAAHDKKLEIICYTDPQVPQYAVGDPGRIRQILMNFTNNAVKFTKEGEIFVGCSLHRETDDYFWFRFFVCDSGIGIPKQKQERIFGAFQQADGSMTRPFGGTGLGLTISKQLIELMQGHISVKSEPGKGSTFAFVIPFDKDQIEQNDRNFTLPAAGRGLSVLVAEANATNRSVLKKMLSRLHLKVETAADGQQALQRLQKGMYNGDTLDILILDLHLPGLDSKEVIGALKQAGILNHIKLIVLGTTDQAEQAAWFHEQGCDSFMLKPLSMVRLSETIKHLFEQKTARIDADQQLKPAEKTGDRSGRTKKRLRRPEQVRILLTEDNQINQKVAEHMIGNAGFRVDIAANGREALKMIAEKKYDLVLMDVQMPVMDGLDATMMIREKENPDTQIPIIAMTAHAMKGDRERCLNAGMNDYISKPIKQAELLELIYKYTHSMPD